MQLITDQMRGIHGEFPNDQAPIVCNIIKKCHGAFHIGKETGKVLRVLPSDSWVPGNQG